MLKSLKLMGSPEVKLQCPLAVKAIVAVACIPRAEERTSCCNSRGDEYAATEFSGFLAATTLHSTHAEQCRRCGCSYEERRGKVAFLAQLLPCRIHDLAFATLCSLPCGVEEHMELEGEPGPIKEPCLTHASS